MNSVPYQIDIFLIQKMHNVDNSCHQQQKHLKHKWTEEEDTRLQEAVRRCGTNNWVVVSQFVPGRTGKQCRERWTGHTCPTIKKESWTPEEDVLLLQYQKVFGNKWAIISQYIPNRSPIMIKNRWNWYLRNKDFFNKQKEEKPKIKFDPIIINDDIIFGKGFEQFRMKLTSKDPILI